MPGGRRLRRALVTVGVIAGTAVVVAPSADASFHLMKIREIKPASPPTSTSNDGYVELQMMAFGQNFVLGHTIDVYNNLGALITPPEGVVLTDDVPVGDNNATIVIGEASSPGGRDFQSNQLNIPASGGAVCFSQASPVECVSWGNFTVTADAMLPATAGMPASPGGITAGKAIQRSIAGGNCSHFLENEDDTDNSLADFSEVTPNPRPNSSPILESECIPPETTIDSGPSGFTASTSAAFGFSAFPPAGATFQCKLDALAPEACNSGSKSYAGLAQGSHTFTVTASNADGPDPTPASRTWTVDTVAPDTAIVAKPDDPSSDNTPSFTYSSNEPTNATFQCKLDTGSFTSCPAAGITYPAQTDASHTFSVRAKDQANNPDASAATYTWTIDTAPPETQIDGGPSGFTVSTSAAFSFSSPNGGTTFQCKIDALTPEACNSGSKSYSGLAQGSHTFTVTATDAAGNPDPTAASRTWTVDTIAPETSIVTKPADPSPDSTLELHVLSTEATNATFKCKLDSEPSFTTCPPGGKDYATQLDGQHTFSVKATDQANNEDSSAASYTWTINTSLPPDTVIDTKPPALTNSPTADFTFHGDGNVTSLQCKLDAEPTFTTCTSPKQYTGLGSASHTLEVRAVGPGGTDATPASHTWTVDLAPPDTSITGNPANPTSSQAASFTYTSTEPSSTFTCKLDAEASFTSCPPTGKSYAGPLAEGAHNFSVIATDPAGNPDPSPAAFPWTIQLLSVPDTTITKPPKKKEKDKTPTVEFTATPPTGATFQCRVDADTFAGCTSPHTTKKLKPGKHSFEVKATNGAGADSTPAKASFKIVKK